MIKFGIRKIDEGQCTVTKLMFQVLDLPSDELSALFSSGGNLNFSNMSHDHITKWNFHHSLPTTVS